MPCRDPRDALRDVARTLLYPFFLLSLLTSLLIGFLCSPVLCFFCARKRRPWNISTDAYILEEADGDEEEAREVGDVTILEAGALPAPAADAPTKGLSNPTASRFLPPPSLPSSLLNLKHVGYSNFYLTSRDGTKLAVDVWLPPAYTKEGGKEGGRTIGCVMHQARYYRSFKLWGPGNCYRNGLPINIINNAYFERFLAQGLAVVSMDIRGSGASYGRNRGPWLEEETDDSLLLLDWIVKQEWSNGRVGLWGISYEGTRALLTGVAGHRAVKAVVPQYAFLDIYTDVGFIGGMHLRGFVKSWEGITSLLDQNQLPKAFLPFAWFSIEGVQPVTGAGPEALKAAVREHRDNWSSTKDGHAVEYTDDKSEFNGRTAADVSPYVFIDAWLKREKEKKKMQSKKEKEQEEGKEAGEEGEIPSFFLISGWFDSTASCAMKLERSLREVTDDVTLIIGPWNHAGVQHARFFPKGATGFRRFVAADEVAQWFAARLSLPPSSSSVPPSRPPSLPPCRYFTMQEEKWRTCTAFPLPSTFRTFRLLAGGGLVEGEGEEEEGSVGGREGVREGGTTMTLHVDLHKAQISKGPTRYTAMTHVFLPMEYDFTDRRILRQQLLFTSEPLTADLEVTGFPLASLLVSSSHQDAALFLFLLCVDKYNKAHYITEGCLRVSSRHTLPPSLPPSSSSVLTYPHVPLHSFLRTDAAFLTPGVPVEVEVAFQPTSYLIKAGQRVRLAVAGSNPKDFLPLRLGEGVYELTLHVDAAGEGQGGGGAGGGEGGGGGEANTRGIGLSRLLLPTLTNGDAGAGNGDGK